MSEEEVKVALDCVYLGRRMLQGNKVGVAYAPIGPDGTLQPYRLFEAKKGFERSIGYVYTGAEWSEQSVWGLSTLKPTGKRWDDEAERLKWKALDSDTAVEKRRAALDASNKAENEYDDMLLPARKAYTSAARRGDMVTCRAIDQAVLMALHRPVRKTEQ